MQRLGKQASTIETVFYGVRSVTVAMQWFGKHASIIEALFLRGPYREVIYKAVEGSAVDC
jgi:hypothetical protein